MFASAFCRVFQGGAVGFSGAFSGAFAGRGRYIGPVMAQAALAGGAGWSLAGGVMQINGRVLIGPAGKIYAFASNDTAARWIENTRGVALREVALMQAIDPATAAAWKVKKRARLAVVAARLVKAAEKINDGRRAALLVESDYCLSKWA